MESKLFCPKCKGIYFMRSGKRKTKTRWMYRYKCLRCNRFFDSPIKIIRKFSYFSSEAKKEVKYNCKLVEYDFKLNKYSIIHPNIKINKKISNENYVKKYYESLNYEVKRLSSCFIINDKYFSIKGLPDLYVKNKDNGFFVEVKTLNDGIKFNQLLFLTKFGGKCFFIFKDSEKLNLDQFMVLKPVKKTSQVL